MLAPRHLLALTAAVALTAAIVSGPAAPSARASRRASASSVATVTTAFRPSRDGFTFRNPRPNPADPVLVRATSGRCGGMTYGALDFFGRGNGVPKQTAALERYLVRRSADSIASNGVKFAMWSVMPDRSRGPLVEGVGDLTRAEELPELSAALEKGPVPLGLVRATSLAEIGRNHQVVAFGIRQEGTSVSVSVYDSCQPGADDVRLVLDTADPTGAVREFAGQWEVARWRGLFVERYSPSSPLD